MNGPGRRDRERMVQAEALWKSGHRRQDGQDEGAGSAGARSHRGLASVKGFRPCPEASFKQRVISLDLHEGLTYSSRGMQKLLRE